MYKARLRGLFGLVVLFAAQADVQQQRPGDVRGLFRSVVLFAARPDAEASGYVYKARLRGLFGLVMGNAYNTSRSYNSIYLEGTTMAVYTQLYLHYVWTTWDRMPLIEPQYEPQLYAVLADKCKEFECIPLAIGGTSDHVHMLVTFTATITIARLVGETKGASSHAMTHSIAPNSFFKWQRAYGAMTIGKRSVPQIQAYILNQKRHHATGSILSALELCVPAHEAA